MVGQYLPQTNEKYYSMLYYFFPIATVNFKGTKHSPCVSSHPVDRWSADAVRWMMTWHLGERWAGGAVAVVQGSLVTWWALSSVSFPRLSLVAFLESLMMRLHQWICLIYALRLYRDLFSCRKLMLTSNTHRYSPQFLPWFLPK